ncbi:MAG: hypothetical protein ACFUZC_04780 [Chthoniobacteraceae bacterium]
MSERLRDGRGLDLVLAKVNGGRGYRYGFAILAGPVQPIKGLPGIFAMLRKFLLRTGPGDHAAGVVELSAMLANPNDRVLITMTGPGDTPPDAILSYIDAVEGAKAQVAVQAMGPLVGADFALWLAAGPIRDVSPNSSVYLYVPGYFGPQTVEGVVWLDAYARCIQIIAKHVDLDSVLGKGIGAGELRDAWLLDCSPLYELAPEPGPEPPSIDPEDRGLGNNDKGISQ